MTEFTNQLANELACKTQHALDMAIFKAIKNKGITWDDIFEIGRRGQVIVSTDGTHTLIIDNSIHVCKWKALDPVFTLEENTIKAVTEYQFQEIL